VDSNRTGKAAIADITALLGLHPLPVEGGMWAQAWRDEHCSAIYYLLAPPEISVMHVLDRVEIFFYHGGAPMRLTLLHPDGRMQRPVLGTDLAAGQRPQVIVPPGVWQAGESLGDWSLVSTAVSPPYVDECVRFGSAKALSARFPEHATVVGPLCGR